ncbi:flavodoxin family protein [Clostridium baratii]|uniref:flavodoxin family protein n=1 Tax=Clostridium baratii TaxID=1561 RepID=UPI003D3297B3
MKVLLVNGSPHHHGCTYTALCHIRDTLKQCGIDSDIFWIGNKAISGCIACKTCVQKKQCVFDDVVNEFLNIAKDYDGYIFGSPVHWGAAGGAITSFMDRVFYADLCGGENRFFLKPAAAVVSARRAGTTATWDQLNKYFALMQMPIVSSRYWNIIHGATSEQIMKDEEGLYTLRVLARNMAYFLRCQEVARDAGLELPKQETPVFTNFIR